MSDCCGTSCGAERAVAVRRGRRLEYLTVGWNVLEGLIAVAAGVWAGSIALVGFGIDSGIEVISGAALLWRLHFDHDPTHRERAEQIALRVVGLCFLALAAYVSWEAIESLANREAPARSLPGVILATLSLVVMPLLAAAKRRVARAIESDAMHADARQTDICFFLSVILLGGLLLNQALGWWWADPVAALCMAPLIGWEGTQALRGRGCGCAG